LVRGGKKKGKASREVADRVLDKVVELLAKKAGR